MLGIVVYSILKQCWSVGMRACSLFLAAILNFDGHFESYINYYKSETFLMPSKTFVDIFIGVLQEIVLC